MTTLQEMRLEYLRQAIALAATQPTPTSAAQLVQNARTFETWIEDESNTGATSR